MRERLFQRYVDFLQAARHALVGIDASLSNDRTHVSGDFRVERNDVAAGDLNSL
jgi:hypothetical protein